MSPTPPRARVRLLLGTLAMALALAACATEEPSTPTASLPPTPATPSPTPPPPPSPTPTEPPDPYAVPAEIDITYVQTVVDVLTAAHGKTFRLAVEAEQVTPEVRERNQALYASPLDAQLTEVLELDLRAGLPDLRRPPGDPVFRVAGLLAASRECISVVGQWDFSAVLLDAPPRTSVDHLKLVPREVGVLEINPTPWEIASRLVREDDVEVNQCAE